MDTSLQCIICPGQPRFCDSSHLLTHVGSKAHLSHSFNLTVRSHDETEASELLEEYELWSKENDIPRQLAERMSNKQARNKKRNSDDNINEPPKKRASDASVSTLPANSISECIDPRLTDPFFVEPEDTKHAVFTPINTPKGSNTIAMSAQSSTGPFLRSGRSSNDWQSMSTSLLENSDYPALPMTPTQPRNRRKPEVAWTSIGDTSEHLVESLPHTSGGVVDKARADEIARLKGVLWPGMDIFDSATLKMKLKRNQKKDGSSLMRMELSSRNVAPVEMVFSPSGALRKLREITGNVELHSPMKGESPIPRRHIKYPRNPAPRNPTLERADPNVPRAMDRKRAKITAQKVVKNAYEPSKKSRKPPRRSQRPVNRVSSCTGEDGEMSLAAHAFGKRSQGGFSIFTDEDDHKYSTKDEEQHYATYLDTLTPKRLVLDGKSNAFGMHGSKIGMETTTLDKENIEPILNPHGRIGPRDWHSPFSKPTTINKGDISPGFFFDESVLDTYYDFNKNGYNANPLLAPAQGPSNDSYDQSHINQTNWQSMGHPVSSEETISEGDQNDFSLIYLPNNTD
ncbi:uncharacterized protein N7511_006358 [Penicillium nucicola]|uniref:uncharacterized protein n=1 Tax=Penicillium nucicola TaxID=1850975 RepID=UPI0025458566|nr:uncharacterized protein N7511_006358 [Penicillium nucicola]KAJ5757664.1 hypothetical protein N7511_006358 [Penicillium nucicola]